MIVQQTLQISFLFAHMLNKTNGICYENSSNIWKWRTVLVEKNRILPGLKKLFSDFIVGCFSSQHLYEQGEYYQGLVKYHIIPLHEKRLCLMDYNSHPASTKAKKKKKRYIFHSPDLQENNCFSMPIKWLGACLL